MGELDEFLAFMCTYNIEISGTIIHRPRKLDVDSVDADDLAPAS